MTLYTMLLRRRFARFCRCHDEDVCLSSRLCSRTPWTAGRRRPACGRLSQWPASWST